MSVHLRVSGSCSARTKKRYICPLNVTPAVQKAVTRRGTYTVGDT